jgi:hypothetical protein
VVFQREHRPGVLGVTLCGHCGGLYMRRILSQRSCVSLTREPAFPCRVNATVPSRRF